MTFGDTLAGDSWFNVPGNIDYREDLPFDNIIMSAIIGIGDSSYPQPSPLAPGFSIETDPDGVPVFIVQNNGTDGVSTVIDPDGMVALVVTDTSTYVRIETDPDGAPVLVGSF